MKSTHLLSFAFMAFLLLLAPSALADWQSRDVCTINTACNVFLLSTITFAPVAGIGETSTNQTVVTTSGNCNITIQNQTTILVNNAVMTTQANGWRNYTFTPNQTGLFVTQMFCQQPGLLGSPLAVVDGSFVATSAGGLDMFGIIILLPLIFGALLILGAAYLGDEHRILRILSYGLAFPLFWASANWAVITAIKFYDFPDLSTAVGSIIYWTGLLFFIVISYFAIYLVWKFIDAAAGKKEKGKDDYDEY